MRISELISLPKIPTIKSIDSVTTIAPIKPIKKIKPVSPSNKAAHHIEPLTPEKARVKSLQANVELSKDALHSERERQRK